MEREFVAIRRIDARNFTLVATVDIFLSLGMPTLYAADTICETIDKYNSETKSALQPLRVYRALSEVQVFKCSGLETSEGPVEAQGQAEEEEICEENDTHQA